MKKKTEGKRPEAIRGTTALINKLLDKKVKREKIMELLTPELIDKGCSERLAKSRVRGLLYREMKKRGGKK